VTCAALGIHEKGGITQLSTGIALVTLGTLSPTMITSTIYKAVGKETVTCGTELLVSNLLYVLLVLPDIIKDVLSNNLMLRSSGPSEKVKITVKPVIDVLVDLVILITDLLAGYALLLRLILSSSTILISPANVEHIVTHLSVITGSDIS